VEVVATGKISAYGERSSYQLIIDRLEYAGEGALLARIEKLRQQAAGRGAVRRGTQAPPAAAAAR
jgi:exodeoxyribonuclease VII large subunit